MEILFAIYLPFCSDGRLEPVDHTVILAFRTVYARRGQFWIGHGIEIHHLVRGQAVVRIEASSISDEPFLILKTLCNPLISSAIIVFI